MNKAIIQTDTAKPSTGTVNDFYQLTKPGIIYGNSLTTIAGFLFGSAGQYHVSAFFGVVLGTALVIGSGCVFNNIIDHRIDAKMERTKKRAIVTGKITRLQALLYGLTLLIVGFLLLLLLTNMLTVFIGIVGFIDYVFVYGYFKRRTAIGTLVGSICGATPVIAGYCAATGQFDSAALLLFLIMVFWQMPHFYSIAIYRGKEYAAAEIPVLPVVTSVKTAIKHILFYTALFVLANVLLVTTGSAGFIYLVVMLSAGLWWFWWGVKGLQTANADKWARKMFGNSLIILLLFSLMISINHWLV
jgi:protoheme IX farnesyltransferase